MNILLNTLIDLDDAAAALVLQEIPGVTVSSRCGMAVLDHEAGVRGDVLEHIATALDDIQRGHCFAALLGDLARARAVIHLLEPYEARATERTKS